MYLHRFFAQQEKPPRGAEPRIELRPALQQADPLPIELRRNILIYSTKMVTDYFILGKGRTASARPPAPAGGERWWRQQEAAGGAYHQAPGGSLSGRDMGAYRKN